MRQPDTNGRLLLNTDNRYKKEALTQLSDREIEEKTVHSFHHLLKFPKEKEPDMIRIFRHKHAIPQ